MFIDHIDHFYEGVVPAFLAYLEESAKNVTGSKLKLIAISAAHQLYCFNQQLEPIFPPGTMDKKTVGKHIVDFELLGNMFNASKHRPNEAPGKLLANAKAVNETHVLTAFATDKGPYQYSHARIILTPNAGPDRDLLDVCTNVMNGWTNFMASNNFINDPVYYRYTGDDFLTREQAAAFPEMTVKVKPGRTFLVNIIARGFDYNTGSYYLIPFKETP